MDTNHNSGREHNRTYPHQGHQEKEHLTHAVRLSPTGRVESPEPGIQFRKKLGPVRLAAMADLARNDETPQVDSGHSEGVT